MQDERKHEDNMKETKLGDIYEHEKDRQVDPWKLCNINYNNTDGFAPVTVFSKLGWDLIKRSISGSIPKVQKYGCEKFLTKESFGPFMDMIKELGLRVVHEFLRENGLTTAFVLVGEETVLHFYVDSRVLGLSPYLDPNGEEAKEDLEELQKCKSFSCGLEVLTGNQDLLKRIIKFFHDNEAPVEKSYEGRAFVLAKTQMGISLMSLGIAGEDIIRGNYAPEVLAGFDGAVGDLKRTSPNGRLIILEGPPGTGKTYLVRSFIDQVPAARFVIIPPHLVSSLADPELVTVFIRHQAEYSLTNNGDATPMVLVLEDADMTLCTRMGDNMSAISSVLNLTDGIMGSLLDLRILATTNAMTQEFDSALLRPGRLSSHIRVGKLSSEQALDIFKRESGDGVVPDDSLSSPKGVTLAEAYAAAKKYQISSLEKKKDAVGFSR